jgi:hypothetical protein
MIVFTVIIESVIVIDLWPDLVCEQVDCVLLDKSGGDQRLPSFLAALVSLHRPIALDDLEDGALNVVVAGKVAERKSA